MSRVQLALNVPNLADAIAFYGALFGAEPHKVREGYANFEVAEPPLKLVLVENDRAEKLNHLGVEVETTAQVVAETRRLAAQGMNTEVEEATVCCHAEQDKVWVRDPGGIRWEVYTITDDLLDSRLEGGGSAAGAAPVTDAAPTPAQQKAKCCC